MAKLTVVVGTEKGGWLLRSDSARKEWKVEGPFFKGWKVTASDRTPSGKFLAATASQVYGAAIHESRDLMEWKQIGKGPAYPESGGRKLTQIWTIHCGAARHFAGVDEAGLFFSDDDGATWAPAPGLNDHPSRASWFPGNGGLCAHAVLTRGKRVWVGISAVGVWRSDDGGKTWAAKNAGVRCMLEDKKIKDIGYCVHALALDSAQDATLYRQDHAGMYRSRDGGDRWEEIRNGLPGKGFGFPLAQHGKSLFAFPLESDEYRLPVGGKFRVYRSRDGGDSWQALSRGLPETPTYANVLRGAMAVDGLSPCGVYVGSTSGEVYASADDGESWRELPCTLPRILHVRAYADA